MEPSLVFQTPSPGKCRATAAQGLGGALPSAHPFEDAGALLLFLNPPPTPSSPVVQLLFELQLKLLCLSDGL